MFYVVYKETSKGRSLTLRSAIQVIREALKAFVSAPDAVAVSAAFAGEVALRTLAPTSSTTAIPSMLPDGLVGPKGFFAMKIMFHIGGNGFAQEAFDVTQAGPVLGAAKRNGPTVCSCSGRAADAVYVGFRLRG